MMNDNAGNDDEEDEEDDDDEEDDEDEDDDEDDGWKLKVAMHWEGRLLIVLIKS